MLSECTAVSILRYALMEAIQAHYCHAIYTTNVPDSCMVSQNIFKMSTYSSLLPPPPPETPPTPSNFGPMLSASMTMLLQRAQPTNADKATVKTDRII